MQLAGKLSCWSEEKLPLYLKLSGDLDLYSELEMAKVDNTLLRAVAKNAVKAMNMYNVKCEALVRHANS